MKARPTTFLKLALFLFAGAATSYGTQFDFSYRFRDGSLMYGTLKGDRSGEFVNNVSDLQVFYSGAHIPDGAAFSAEFGDSTSAGVPVVSFDASKNNFLFSNASNGSGATTGGAFRYIIGSHAVISRSSETSPSFSAFPSASSFSSLGSDSLVFSSLSIGAGATLSLTSGAVSLVAPLESLKTNDHLSVEVPVESSWSLTAQTASVPDGGATLILLGLGLAGTASFRRKFGI